MPASIRHPLFARFFDRMCAADLKAGRSTEHRTRLLAGLAGRVIEVGAGSGGNFGFYPDTVAEVVAVEPEPYLRAKAQEASASAPVAIRVVEGTADSLPGADGEFDAAVLSLVLCSVPDQGVALAEVRRVIRPEGELRFYEHVASTNPKLARFQRLADRTFWPRCGGGCHTHRDSAAAIARAGFSIEGIDRFDFSTIFFDRLVSPHILGRARRP